MEQEPDAFEKIEKELGDLLRRQYGVVPHNLELSSTEQIASERRNRRTIERILAKSATSATPPRTGRPRRRILIAAAAAMLMTAGGLVALFATGSGEVRTPADHMVTPPLLNLAADDDERLDTEPANLVLTRLARRASLQPALDPAMPVKVVETTSWALQSPSDRRVIPQSTRYYRHADGRVRLLAREIGPLTGSGLIDQASPDADFVEIRDTVETIKPDELPSDPVRLRAFLTSRDRCTDSQAECVFDAVEALGRSYLLEPSISSALLRALLGIDDVTYLGHTRDRTGRISAVFTVESPAAGEQRLLLIDAGTGQYAGDETVVLEGKRFEGVAGPAVIEFNAVTQRRELEGFPSDR